MVFVNHQDALEDHINPTYSQSNPIHSGISQQSKKTNVGAEVMPWVGCNLIPRRPCIEGLVLSVVVWEVVEPLRSRVQ